MYTHGRLCTLLLLAAEHPVSQIITKQRQTCKVTSCFFPLYTIKISVVILHIITGCHMHNLLAVSLAVFAC